jgi:hypothetical protein
LNARLIESQGISFFQTGCGGMPLMVSGNLYSALGLINTYISRLQHIHYGMPLAHACRQPDHQLVTTVGSKG